VPADRRINLDAVEEFKILTNAYAAEYGRSSGAQLSLVTKSGGRDFRGSAYGYRRQESVNGNTFINNRERGRALQSDPNTKVGLKPINRQTDVGFTFGGPVPLGAYNKDRNRLFFFAFENQRRFTPPANPNRVKVPTLLERQGDFSQSRNNNNNNNPFPYIRDYYNFESQVAVQIDRREEIFRADWQASSAWRICGRYFHNSKAAATSPARIPKASVR
jgi:hypothetical protein